MASPNDYRHDNLHGKSLGVAIHCTRNDLRVDLSIAKSEIGAVDGLDGRVLEIGDDSLMRGIVSRSNFKRYAFVILAPHLDRGFGTAPPSIT
jgi:hypothetical protein